MPEAEKQVQNAEAEVSVKKDDASAPPAAAAKPAANSKVQDLKQRLLSQ